MLEVGRIPEDVDYWDQIRIERVDAVDFAVAVITVDFVTVGVFCDQFFVWIVEHKVRQLRVALYQTQDLLIGAFQTTQMDALEIWSGIDCLVEGSKLKWRLCFYGQLLQAQILSIRGRNKIIFTAIFIIIILGLHKQRLQRGEVLDDDW